MAKWTKPLLVSCLMCLIIISGVSYRHVHNISNEMEETKGEEVMTNGVYIDPEIDLKSEKNVIILIHFKTKPAKAAVALAEMSGVPLTLEKAIQDVDDSHMRFQEDVKKYLGQQQIPYTIIHTYKSALNGVAIKLPANEINTLLQSAEIAAIYTNKEYKLTPPLKAH